MILGVSTLTPLQSIQQGNLLFATLLSTGSRDTGTTSSPPFCTTMRLNVDQICHILYRSLHFL